MKRFLVLAITGVVLAGVTIGCGPKEEDLPAAKTSGVAGDATGTPPPSGGGVEGGGGTEARIAPLPGGKGGGR